MKPSAAIFEGSSHEIRAGAEALTDLGVIDSFVETQSNRSRALRVTLT